ncbi:unnamed protein product [Coffea canephora]|uniref:Glycosyltransferase n=1 Tax=Coffea canephora TaxID=49390 RepID=A0A068VED1_COFCA|nr:unnamed protein product [Coffea canephora]
MVAISSPHFVIFPFMAKGHTIPLLYLARLLWQRHVSVTIFTTPANSLSIRATLHDTSISIIELTFPESIDGIPSGVESTDKLPSMSLFIDFATATKLMQPQFEQALEGLQPVSCIVSDHFMGWTQDSAAKLGIPRIGFSGMSCFGMTMYETLGRQKPHALTSSLDEPFSIPNFPKLTLTRSDFDPPFDQLEPKGPKSWCLGPFCIAKAKTVEDDSTKPKWKQWLDDKAMIGESVLYVAFGTQAEVSEEQILEIAKGLEQSYVNFLWVIRPKAMEILKGFEERVKDRGLMVKEWVDQMEILQHKSVKGFLSHCGWNSVTEAICAGVPILAMPFMAEQYLNARLVAEEISVGLRIRPSNGSVRGFVKSEEVEERVREMIEGRKGEEIRKKTKKVGEAAVNAMREGGSSWKTLDQLIIDVSNYEAIS